MIIDEKDLKILKSLWDIKDKKIFPTTSDMAKKIFKKEIENAYDLRGKDAFIRTRLEKLDSLNLTTSKKENGKALYYINPQNCSFMEGDLILRNNGKNISLDKGNFFIFKNKDRINCLKI